MGSRCRLCSKYLTFTHKNKGLCVLLWRSATTRPRPHSFFRPRPRITIDAADSRSSNVRDYRRAFPGASARSSCRRRSALDLAIFIGVFGFFFSFSVVVIIGQSFGCRYTSAIVGCFRAGAGAGRGRCPGVFDAPGGEMKVMQIVYKCR